MASTILFVIVLYKIYCVVLYSRVLTLFEGESTLMEVQFLFLDRVRELFIDFVKAATTFFGEINRHSSSNMSHLHNPYQKEDSFGRGVTANQKATIRAFDKFYSW